MKLKTNTRYSQPADRLAQGKGRGFTLLEVMLAIVIFSIVLTAIHTVFYAAVQLRNKTTEAIEQRIPLQQTLAIIKRDLANIVMPGGTFAGELQTSQTGTSSTNSTSSLAQVNDALPGQSSPAFFTASGPISDELPWSDIERVTYFLAPPTNNTPGKVLVRSVTRNLLPVFPEEPENQPLMSGLLTIAFSYYDGIQWREYWDSTIETNKLPQGIKVELQLVSEGSGRGQMAPIELVVPIVLQAGTNASTQTSGGAL